MLSTLKINKEAFLKKYKLYLKYLIISKRKWLWTYILSLKLVGILRIVVNCGQLKVLLPYKHNVNQLTVERFNCMKCFIKTEFKPKIIYVKRKFSVKKEKERKMNDDHRKIYITPNLRRFKLEGVFYSFMDPVSHLRNQRFK